MNFLSINFWILFIFIFVTLACVPGKYKYLPLLLANCIFYGTAQPMMLWILFGITAITYIGGRVIEKQRRPVVFAVFFGLCLLVLIYFKYTNYMIENLNWILDYFHLDYGKLGARNIVAPIGLSFFIFQSTSYLSDVYRKGFSAEKNFFRYAAFVSFFPTVLSGPIQKSRILLPQLKEEMPFSVEYGIKSFILLLWGVFEKIIVANGLAIIVNGVFDQYTSYDGIYYLIAAICFSFYIYADFSAYSDMACGIAGMLGFHIEANFKNPYLSVSFAGFWNHWHMTLNSWFTENIYIPLGGNRKGKLRKYINIMVVFLFSGIWHGASNNFLVWGGLNGVLRIVGEEIRPWREKLYAYFHVDSKTESIIILKRISVFFIITVTWVFFRIPDMEVALHIIKNMFLFQPITLFDSNLLTIAGSAIKTIKIAVALQVFLYIQYLRKDAEKNYQMFRKQPVGIQCLLLSALLCMCIFAMTSTTSSVNTEFIYVQF